MQLEAGKKYTDRRGRVYGPLVTDSQFYAEQFGCQLWYNDGRITPGKQFDMDLVAEYVEPPLGMALEKPAEYRALNEGETIQPGDEYLGYSEKWEKVPSSGNVFKSSLYHPHRRLVEPVKAAEPIDNRVAPGEGYRLLDIGEVELDTDEWYSHMDGEWSPTSLVGCKINKIDVEQGYSIRRKVEPAPVESPDDWVTQDRVPGRVGIDYQNWRPVWRVDRWADITPMDHANGKRHGYIDGMGDTLSLRCRRKDLPPVPPKTRTVVLKEWLCWDDEGPKVLLWQDINPTSDDIEYNNFHHAVETGNTRTVEIPVT